MKTEDFDYELPERFIAQQPAIPRDSCKLMVVNRDGSIEHRVFRDIGEYLRAGDLLVVNETRVLPARLLGHKKGTGGAVEMLLLDKVADAVDTADEQTWNCLVKPGKRLKPGALVEFEHDGAVVLEGEVIGIDDANGSRSVRFTAPGDTGVDAAIHLVGHTPLPPYIKDYVGDEELYQT
ncbi:MAG: S-adenosylmethionine:tRNA ribosyltransferase-isomerase, partial [Bacteroidales bacterium]